MKRIGLIASVLLFMMLFTATPLLSFTLIRASSSSGSTSYWYTGQFFNGAGKNATTVSVEQVVPSGPSSFPNPNATDFIGLSVWDANNNYDQLGMDPGVFGSGWYVTDGALLYSSCTPPPSSGSSDYVVNVGFTQGDLINFSISTSSNGYVNFTAYDVTANKQVWTNSSFWNGVGSGGYFENTGCGGVVGSNSPYSNYEENQQACNDVPTFNFLFTNDIFGGVEQTSGWGITVVNSGGSSCSPFTNYDNATAIGQDQGGFNALIYNLYNRQDTGLTPSTDSLSLAYSSPYLYAALSQGTCTSTSCDALYAGYGAQPSSFSEVFPKITGEGDGISSLGTPSIATGNLSYLGGNPTVVYAWPRTSDSHALISYYNGTNGKWYGPFDTGVSVSTSPSVAIAPDPSGSTAIWMAYAASSNQEIHLMYSDNGGLTWHQEAASGQYANQTLNLAAHSGTLFVSWIGANNIIDTASFATASQSWSNVGSLTGVSASGIGTTYVNTNYPFVMATWEDTSSSEIGLAALSYQQVDSATPTLSYVTYITTTTPTNGYDTQSLASAANQVSLGFIYSSTNTLNTYWTQF